VLGDVNGNFTEGDVLANDCQNTMILGDKRLIVGIKLKDLMVVATLDVLLLAKRGESQKVKEVVDELKTAKRQEVDENVTVYRPWGSYTVLAEGPGCKVKRLTVKSLNRMSLQMHFHRSEHWPVINGIGKLTLDDKEIIFRENDSTYIPIGTKHRLENPGKIPLTIIEVQNGKYLGEDDIIRCDDDYER
jgi:mannose-1-phosphate guanylyltransferase/mannose-6-phosphate isomerase